MAAIDDEPAGPKETSGLVANEPKKLTATYLNVLAGSFFSAGVAAPIAAAVFGVTGSSSPIADRRVDTGIGHHDLHGGQRRASCRGACRPQGPEAMTDIQVVAFIITPLMGLAVGLGVAYWARHAD